MRKIDELFGRYDESHRNRSNKIIHWICVPLIMWSVLAALWAWTPLAAYVLLALALAFYVSISLPIASTMTSSAGRRAAMNRRAACFDSARRSPAMLKLRSRAIVTDSGTSPAAKAVMVWGA